MKTAIIRPKRNHSRQLRTFGSVTDFIQRLLFSYLIGNPSSNVSLLLLVPIILRDCGIVASALEAGLEHLAQGGYSLATS